MWARFAAHRQQVTTILSQVAGKAASLCILGAGALNDVSLDTLLPLYRDIHLVDLDLDSLQAGVARQKLGTHAQVHLQAPLDLSGIAAHLPDAAVDKSGGGQSSKAVLRRLAGHRCRVPCQPFDVVVSAALLSQMIQAVAASALTPDDVTRVSLALRDKHLIDLLHLTAPGGTVVLICDMVSSATAPDILRAKPADLDAVMAALISAGNFFTGTNPFRIADLLATDARMSDMVEEVHLIAPWLWRVREDRQHLTYALIARRKMTIES